MSIDTNIHTKLTDTEVNRFGEIEAALSKSESSGQLELFRKFMTAFHDLHSDLLPIPGNAKEANEMIDATKVYLELVNCLPVLRELREVKPYILLGKMLYHFYLKFGLHAGKYRPNLREIEKILKARNRHLGHGSYRGLQIYYYKRFFEMRCEEIALEVGKSIAEHSVPKLVQLVDFPPEYEIVKFGNSTIEPKRYGVLTVKTDNPVDDWVLARYLLFEKEFKYAAKLFEKSRLEATEPYQVIALTAWMCLARLLHCDEEETRKLYTQSVAHVARCQNPNAKAEAKEIETMKLRLLGEWTA